MNNNTKLLTLLIAGTLFFCDCRTSQAAARDDWQLGQNVQPGPQLGVAEYGKLYATKNGARERKEVKDMTSAELARVAKWAANPSMHHISGDCKQDATLVGVTFSELIIGIKRSIDPLKNTELHKALLQATRRAVYEPNSDSEDGRVIASHEALQGELRRLENGATLVWPHAVPVDSQMPENTMRNNTLWPLTVWAIENDNPELTAALMPLVGLGKRVDGNQKSAEEIAKYLNSQRALQKIEDYKKHVSMSLIG